MPRLEDLGTPCGIVLAQANRGADEENGKPKKDETEGSQHVYHDEDKANEGNEKSPGNSIRNGGCVKAHGRRIAARRSPVNASRPGCGRVT